jgi:hypothetical protein
MMCVRGRAAWPAPGLTFSSKQYKPARIIAGAKTLDRQCAMRLTGLEGDIVFACVKDENTRSNAPSQKLNSLSFFLAFDSN